MASGEVHKRDSIWLSPIVGFGTAMLFDPVVGIASAVGCLSGVLISPDLDQDGKTTSEIVLWKLFVPLGYAYQIFWYPYALLIPHRHWFSHMPVVGTVGRILYLFSGCCLLNEIIFRFFGTYIAKPSWFYLFPWFVLGLMISDFAHWLRDR